MRLHPDIVLLDIAMPQVNGIQAARQIKQQSPAVRIVFVTQKTDKAYKEAAAEIGVDGYVLKSTAARDLPATLVALRQHC